LAIYGVPYLQLYRCLLVDSDFLGVILDARCHLIVVAKGVLNVFHEEGGLPNAFITQALPDDPMSSTLNDIFPSVIVVEKESLTLLY
jgi:hypothetical protein